jgi:iron complex outermembrane receptor protein
MTAPASAVIDEIIVTAQKRSENLQRVPISVAVISGEKLDSMFVAGDDILALAARVPSLNVESSNGRVAPRFYIRGLGNTDFDLAASQSVSVIMDDVVLENVVLKSSPIFDIEQVEVLRGPQGTLFGRNTPAGIVKFTTVKPSDENEAYLRASYGTYGSRTAEGAVGGALGESASGRLSLLYQGRDDWIDNLYTGENEAMGGFDEFAGRAQLLFSAGDDVDILLNIHGRDLDGTAAIFRANVLGPGNNDLNANYDPEWVYFDGGANNPQSYDGMGGSIKVDWSLSDGVSLTSITAIEETSGSSRGDIDGGVAGDGPGFIPFSSDTEDGLSELTQFTQEFRLASENTDGYSWQLGAYYFDGDFTIQTDSYGCCSSTVQHENTAWAIFGQGTYDMSEDLTITAGIRYTDDEKDLNVIAAPVATGTTSASDEQVSWDLSALYTLSDTTNLYARVASGFRGPSIQGRDVTFFGVPSVAKSETIMSYEAGFKTEGDMARINGAAFYYVIDDVQLTAVGGAGNLIQLINAEEAVGYGFEVDAEFAPSDNLLITAGFSYNHTEINDPNLLVGGCAQCTVTDTPNGGFFEVDGNPLPQAPEIIFNATARYGVPMGPDHELFFYTDWAYQGDTNLFLYESLEFNTDSQYEGGLKIGYAKNDGSFEVALFARNITDEHNVKGGIDFNNNTAYVNDPRIIGLSISFRR